MKGIDRFNYSLEDIAFQDGKLFAKISSIFKDIKDKGEYKKNMLSKSNLDKIVFESTGILTSTEFVPNSLYFHIFPPKITPNNILISEHARLDQWYSDGMKFTKNSKSPIQGTVDTKRCKVDGVFKTFKCLIQMDPVFFFDKRFDLTPDELTAIYLHEVGHAFTAFEYLVETASTNQVLNSISKRLLETNNHEERIVFLSQVEKDLQIKIQDKQTLAKSENRDSVYGVLLSGRIDAMRSSTDTWVYDIKSWEFLADQFSIRHGAGSNLASGLNKLVVGSGGSVKTTKVDAIIDLLTITFWMGVATVLCPPVGILFSMLNLFLPAIIYKNPHDDGVQRLNRMKIDLTELLKNPEISSELKTNTIESIADIDKLLEQMEDTRGAIEAMWDILRPAKRDARKQYEFQMKMEKLAGNSMFVHAAKLSNLS